MTAAQSEFRISLPWFTPPLSLNDRHGRHAHARIAREVRSSAHWLAKSHRLPRGCKHVTVELHYRPSTNRKRDTDNLTATAKPIYDGLVDAGVVADDTPDRMTKREPIIHPADTTSLRGHLWLVVTVDRSAA